MKANATRCPADLATLNTAADSFLEMGLSTLKGKK